MRKERKLINAFGERIGLSIEEAAETVGLSRATFLKLVYSGDIPSKTIGRRRLIPTAGLKAWMHAGMDISPVPVSEILSDEEFAEAQDLQLRKALASSIDQETLNEIRSAASNVRP